MAKHARTKKRLRPTRRFTRRSVMRALKGPVGIVLALCVVGAGGYALLSRLLGSSSINVMDTLRARGTITVGVQRDRTPYGQMDDSGKASGFEPELATALCESILGTGCVQFVGVNPKTARAQLDQGNCDVLFSMVVVSDVNQNKYQLSEAYAQEPVSLLSRGGQSVDLGSAGTRIGVIPSSNAKTVLTTYLSANKLSATVVDISSYPDVKDALSRGTIHAFCAEASALQLIASGDLQISSQIVGQLNYAFAVRSGEKDLYQALQKALTAMKQDGRLAQLYSKYQLTAPVQ